MGNSRLIKIIFPLDIKSLTIKERVCSILFYTVPLLLLAMFTCINRFKLLAANFFTRKLKSARRAIKKFS